MTLIADDHCLFRDAVRDVVTRLFAMRGWDLVCLEPAEQAEVFAIAVAEQDLDLILLDLFMPAPLG